MTLTQIEKDFLNLKSGLGINKKFYHLKTIENFIYHFNQIKYQKDREFVLSSLSFCLEYYKVNSIKDINHSLVVFKKYLEPIGTIYQEQVGFSILIKPWILTISILAINLFIYFLNTSLILTLLCNLILLAFVLFLAVKYNNKKLYAFLW